MKLSSYTVYTQDCRTQFSQCCRNSDFIGAEICQSPLLLVISLPITLLLSSPSLAPRGSPFDMEGLRARLIMEKPERFGAPLTRKATPASPSPFHLYTSSLIMLHPSTHSPLHLSTCLPVHFIMSSAPELISSLFHPSTHSLLHLSNPPPSPHPPTHSFTSPTLHPLDHPSTSHPSISHLFTCSLHNVISS